MMTFFLLVTAEIFLGIIVGFILSDNKRGLSIEEVKISSILFLISTAVVFWQNPHMDAIVFTHLALSWFVLIVGVILGEMIKMNLISKIIRTIHKKDIQIAINELVQIAGRIQHQRGEDEATELYHKLHEVQELLSHLSARSRKLQSEEFMKKLHYLFELCEDYTTLSIKISNDRRDALDESTVATWKAIGKELTSLSWDTLNHAEENVKHQLGKAFSVKVVHKALSK